MLPEHKSAIRDAFYYFTSLSLILYSYLFFLNIISKTLELVDHLLIILYLATQNMVYQLIKLGSPLIIIVLDQSFHYWLLIQILRRYTQHQTLANKRRR